jgi:hypothetical protein
MPFGCLGKDDFLSPVCSGISAKPGNDLIVMMYDWRDFWEEAKDIISNF